MKKFAYPYYMWMLVFVVLPLVIILLYAFTPGNEMMIEDISFTTEHLQRFLEPVYLQVLWTSIVYAFWTTVICLVLGYPVAYYVSKQSRAKRSTLILLMMIPMWMNFLLRTYAWLTLLSAQGPINRLLVIMGIGPVNLLYKDMTVIMGMIYNYLPFMVLPIYSVLVKIDPAYLEAAGDLGANPRETFFKVIWPLSLSGIVTGIIMVFIPALSTFVITSLLGGNKYNLIGNLIEQQFRYTGDWHFGAAMSVVLMLFIIVGMRFLRKLNKDGGQSMGVNL